MEDINYQQLIKIVLSSVKKTYIRREFNNKMVPNLANLGGRIGDIAKLERTGEYYGITVKLLENLRPLLTDKIIIRILNLLENEDFITPITLLTLNDIDQLQYVLHVWFENATFNYDNQFKNLKKKIYFS